MNGPYHFDPHPFTWAILVAVAVAVVAGHRWLAGRSVQPISWPRRQVTAFFAGWGVAAVALTWPLGDLAAHWSLTALVTQRVLLVLAVTPLVLLGLPYDVLERITRPTIVDTVLTWLRRPLAAIITVTALFVGSMAVPFVDAQSSSVWARGLFDLVVLTAGVVLWIPVLGRIPGIFRLRPVVRFGYLMVQAVVPAFLSFVVILSGHAIYATFVHSHQAIGLRPLNDQQVAGFVSKLSMLVVLVTVGGVVLSRATATRDQLGGEEPLLWADVERQFQRAERQRDARRAPVDGKPDRRTHRSNRPGGRGSIDSLGTYDPPGDSTPPDT